MLYVKASRKDQVKKDQIPPREFDTTKTHCKIPAAIQLAATSNRKGDREFTQEMPYAKKNTPQLVLKGELENPWLILAASNPSLLPNSRYHRPVPSRPFRR
jgi:hypothetical protein